MAELTFNATQPAPVLPLYDLYQVRSIALWLVLQTSACPSRLLRRTLDLEDNLCRDQGLRVEALVAVFDVGKGAMRRSEKRSLQERRLLQCQPSHLY